MTLDLTASTDLNPDPAGRPSPVVVRLYQLSTADAFSAAEFSALYRNETVTLGKALIARQEIEAVPGEHTELHIELANETRSLGVLVAFRDSEHARWRSIRSAEPVTATLSLSANEAKLK